MKNYYKSYLKAIDCNDGVEQSLKDIIIESSKVHLSNPNKKILREWTNIFGYEVLLQMDQYESIEIYNDNYEEQKELDFLKTQIQNNDICVDIGANIGIYTLLFAKYSKQVISFEPISSLTDILDLTLKINNINNVMLYNFVCGNETKLVNFVEEFQKQISYVSNNNEQKSYKPMIKVDDLNLHKIDILKIDTEGYELEILKGMQQTLKRTSPRLIMLEVIEEFLNKYDTCSDDLIKFLKSLNYTPTELKDNRLVSWSGKNTESDNLFFVKNSN